MKKKDLKVKNNKKVDSKKITNLDMLFIDVQMVLTILTIIVFILYLFNNRLISYLELSLGCSLIVMGYNNLKIYKRKKITIAYFIVGIVILVLDFVTLIGG